MRTPKIQIGDVFELALQSGLSIVNGGDSINYGLRIGSDCVLLPGDVILKETPGFPNGFIPLRFDSRIVHYRLIDCSIE